MVDGVGEREQKLLLKGGQEGLTPPPTFYQGTALEEISHCWIFISPDLKKGGEFVN